MRRLVLLLAGLHTEKCPQTIAEEIRTIPGVQDIRVAPLLKCEHKTIIVGCEYGIAQILFDPDVATSGKILLAIKPPYWADVITENPLVPATEGTMTERKRAAIFA